MEKSIKEIEKELAALEHQKSTLESKLSDIVEQAICNVAKKQKINRISEHIVIVRLSDMVGNPWNYQFYDWSQSISIVKRFLRAKPVIKWKDELQKKLNDTQKDTPVIFIFSSGSGWYRTQERIPVSYQFIQEIIKQLDK